LADADCDALDAALALGDLPTVEEESSCDDECTDPKPITGAGSARLASPLSASTALVVAVADAATALAETPEQTPGGGSDGDSPSDVTSGSDEDAVSLVLPCPAPKPLLSLPFGDFEGATEADISGEVDTLAQLELAAGPKRRAAKAAQQVAGAAKAAAKQAAKQAGKEAREAEAAAKQAAKQAGKEARAAEAAAKRAPKAVCVSTLGVSTAAPPRDAPGLFFGIRPAPAPLPDCPPSVSLDHGRDDSSVSTPASSGPTSAAVNEAHHQRPVGQSQAQAAVVEVSDGDSPPAGFGEHGDALSADASATQAGANLQRLVRLRQRAPPGFRIEARTRASGKTRGHVDYYFISPEGKSFRSLSEICNFYSAR